MKPKFNFLAGKPELIMSLVSGGLGLAQMLVSNKKEAFDKMALKNELKDEILKELLAEMNKIK